MAAHSERIMSSTPLFLPLSLSLHSFVTIQKQRSDPVGWPYIFLKHEEKKKILFPLSFFLAENNCGPINRTGELLPRSNIAPGRRIGSASTKNESHANTLPQVAQVQVPPLLQQQWMRSATLPPCSGEQWHPPPDYNTK